MKKVVYSLIFIILFIFTQNIFANNIQYNTENNIKKAILIEDYVSRHKENVLKFIGKYDISNNNILSSDISDLNESIKALKKIQTTEIEKQKAEEVMQAVLERIKQINKRLKVQLEKEKQEYLKKIKDKKGAFAKLGRQIAYKIDNINLKIANNVFKNKTVLSLKESKLKEILIRLNKESLKLKNFGNYNFKSEIEIKKSFIKILQKIKIEINLMKETLK